MCDINVRCAHIFSDMENNYTGFPETEFKAEMKLKIQQQQKRKQSLNGVLRWKQKVYILYAFDWVLDVIACKPHLRTSNNWQKQQKKNLFELPFSRWFQFICYVRKCWWERIFYGRKPTRHLSVIWESSEALEFHVVINELTAKVQPSLSARHMCKSIQNAIYLPFCSLKAHILCSRHSGEFFSFSYSVFNDVRPYGRHTRNRAASVD